MGPLVYDGLRGLAAPRMAREQPGRTRQPTALVHEADLRLVGQGDPAWLSRDHLFAVPAETMRHIPVDSAGEKRLSGSIAIRKPEANSQASPVRLRIS